MKRRSFLQLVGASALGLPFMSSELGSTRGRTGATPSDEQRRPWRLPFSLDESEVFSGLSEHAKGVYLVGGGVLAKAAGRALPYLNLVVDSDHFAALKQELFHYGVAPVSTPDLPSEFIRFVHQGKAYSALNLGLEAYLKSNVFGQKLRLLPLAHNYLVCSPTEAWVIDPHGALADSPESGRIQFITQPESAIVGLELCLAVAFDTT